MVLKGVYSNLRIMDNITYNDFEKVDIRIGTVTKAEEQESLLGYKCYEPKVQSIL